MSRPCDLGRHRMLWVSRSGYTGEDGYEISVPRGRSRLLAEACWQHGRRGAHRSGARDSSAAGSWAYAFTAMTSTASTTPVEAGLTWAMQKARRPGGARRRLSRRRCHSRRTGGKVRPAAASACALKAARRCAKGNEILLRRGRRGRRSARVTSGGFGPTVGARLPWVMSPANSAVGPAHSFLASVRGKRLPRDGRRTALRGPPISNDNSKGPRVRPR